MPKSCHMLASCHVNTLAYKRDTPVFFFVVPCVAFGNGHKRILKVPIPPNETYKKCSTQPYLAAGCCRLQHLSLLPRQRISQIVQPEHPIPSPCLLFPLTLAARSVCSYLTRSLVYAANLPRSSVMALFLSLYQHLTYVLHDEDLILCPFIIDSGVRNYNFVSWYGIHWWEKRNDDCCGIFKFL